MAEGANRRRGAVHRQTAETDVRVVVDLDGTGAATLELPVPFLRHMLEQVARHGRLDLEVTATGDTDVDGHHTVEDVGICFGKAVREALGDRRGIERFGDRRAPLDEALCEAVVDVSGRPHLEFGLQLPKARLGTFEVELVREFYLGFVRGAGCTLHVRQVSGWNLHHIVEASFKAFALALRDATRRTHEGLPSTKDHLD